ncbi:MAG: helix-turn-helix domain-containing protein [Actinomycetota bacterium]|nr:helix-turn-helix domain-containing protein [Actinomycetota bacterium]
MEVNEELLYRAVGERVRRRREEVQMTQSRLGAEAGVLRTSVTNIEAGRQRPPLHLLFKICAALGVETSTMMPANVDVTQPEAVPVEVDGEVKLMPPRAAEALERLRRFEQRGEDS